MDPTLVVEEDFIDIQVRLPQKLISSQQWESTKSLTLQARIREKRMLVEDQPLNVYSAQVTFSSELKCSEVLAMNKSQMGRRLVFLLLVYTFVDKSIGLKEFVRSRKGKKIIPDPSVKAIVSQLVQEWNVLQWARNRQGMRLEYPSKARKPLETALFNAFANEIEVKEKWHSAAKPCIAEVVKHLDNFGQHIPNTGVSGVWKNEILEELFGTNLSDTETKANANASVFTEQTNGLFNGGDINLSKFVDIINDTIANRNRPTLFNKICSGYNRPKSTLNALLFAVGEYILKPLIKNNKASTEKLAQGEKENEIEGARHFHQDIPEALQVLLSPALLTDLDSRYLSGKDGSKHINMLQRKYSAMTAAGAKLCEARYVNSGQRNQLLSDPTMAPESNKRRYVVDDLSFNKRNKTDNASNILV